MILIIDNNDSFTYNLVQMLGTLGADLEVHLDGVLPAEEVAARKPAGIVISSGPGGPDSAAGSRDIVRRMGSVCPILGVGLGHQIIGAIHGARIERVPAPIHGRTSRVEHDSRELFVNLPNPFEACRYHSLHVVESTLPDDLVVTARSDDGLVMGLRHVELPLEGIQFHPESICTPDGEMILSNFLRIATHPTAGWRAIRGKEPVDERK